VIQIEKKSKETIIISFVMMTAHQIWMTTGEARTHRNNLATPQTSQHKVPRGKNRVRQKYGKLLKEKGKVTCLAMQQ